MKIAVVGTGYVGLVSGVCFAEIGHHVVCCDIDAAKIATLKDGSCPIFEEGLGDILASNLAQQRIAFTTRIERSVADADVVFIAVGTPSRRGDGHADLSYVFDAARTIAAALTGFTVVVNKSTVPVGTGDAVAKIIRDINPTADFAVVSNPEFLREGAAVLDFLEPDRIVIGTDDERAIAAMRQVYAPLKRDVVVMGRRSAETVKYAANSFLAVKIAFTNELADLCEALGADITDVAPAMGMDARIGSQFLRPGPGFGGSCFPKDSRALLRTAQDASVSLSIVEAMNASNERRKLNMAAKIIAACSGTVNGKTIGVLGLAFKANTDDMRESPALTIIEKLLNEGATIQAFDPAAKDQARVATQSFDRIEQLKFAKSAGDAAEGADALVVLTEWPEFGDLDLIEIKEKMRSAVLVDMRNIFRGRPDDRAGFDYHSIG